MATMALPIRELSANVQYEAAYAQKAFWEVAEGKARTAHFDVLVWLKTRQLSHSMDRLVELQELLIARLQQTEFSSLDSNAFDKIASDLERLVSLTLAFVDDAYGMPEKCLRVWRPKLERIADLTGYIDNFAESFRIASDEACTALMADIAGKVIADVKESVSAH